MSRKPRFRPDHAGITRLLLRDTYDRDDVYLRELITNAMDSGAGQLDLTLILTPDAATVAGILCIDDGRGMTRNCLETFFFNLGKPYDGENGPRYGRFGIGVFTYLKVARRIEMITGAPRGRRWHVAMTPPADIVCMEDVLVSGFGCINSEFTGTCVLLLLRSEETLASVRESLKYYIRAPIPARLILRTWRTDNTTQFDLPALVKNLPIGTPVDAPWSTDIPENAAIVPRTELIENGYVSVAATGNDKVALCESGIFIEEANRDLLPHTFEHLVLDALVSVPRGRLDLVSSRTKARRSSEFFRIRESLVGPVKDACQKFFTSRRWTLRVSQVESLQEIAEICHWLSAQELVTFLTTIERQVYLETYTAQGTGLLALADIGRRAQSAPLLACVEGEAWGWKKGAGNIGGYDYEVFVHQRGFVESALAQGALVFHCPNLEKIGPVLPRLGLQQYFRIRHSVLMQDVANVSCSDAVALPKHWRNGLSLPNGMRLGTMPTGRTVLLDSNLNAILDSRDAVVRWLDAALSWGVRLDSKTIALAEIYILLLGARLDEAFRIVRRELLRRIEGSGSRTLGDLAQEVRNGK